MKNKVLKLSGACLLVLATGCGFLFVNGPPENHEKLPYFSCTESNAGPILDVVWAGIQGLALAGNANNGNGSLAAVNVAWIVVSGAASYVGFDKTSRCRDAKLQLAMRQGQVVAAGQPSGLASPQGVSIKPADDTLKVGATVQLVAEARASSGALMEGQAYTWTSSNDAIASVNATGLVTAHAPGQVAVAARTGSLVGVANILVLPR